jgi:CRP-like cAMP-binding protein
LKGEVVFNQGDKGEEFYVILSGCVGVYIKGYSDDTENGLSFVVQREVCVLGPGESFGELALLKGKHGLRAATIICKENTDLAYFTANVFNKLLLEKEKDRYDANLGFL